MEVEAVIKEPRASTVVSLTEALGFGMAKFFARGIHAGVIHTSDESLCVLYLVNDSLESSGIVEREVGEDFAVDLDACFVDKAHEL